MRALRNNDQFTDGKTAQKREIVEFIVHTNSEIESFSKDSKTKDGNQKKQKGDGPQRKKD